MPLPSEAAFSACLNKETLETMTYGEPHHMQECAAVVRSFVAVAGGRKPRCSIGPRPLGRAGWGDLPGELHREILRLVPLRDATAARGVSREMRDEVDEGWRAWGISATAEDKRKAVYERFRRHRFTTELAFSPLAVWAFEGSHAHHLASMGLWWLALLVAEAPDLNAMAWGVGAYRYMWTSDEHESENDDERFPDQSPLMLAVQAQRPMGRGADGEVARAVRLAVAMGADVNRRLRGALPLMSYCAGRGCLEAIKACLAAGAEVDATREDDGHVNWWTALVHAARGGHEAVFNALVEAGAEALAHGEDDTLTWVCRGHPTPGIVRRLVEAGADVSAWGLRGRPAIFCAAYYGNVAVMETLEELGADVAGIDSRGVTAMSRSPTGEVVRWLAARGVSIQGGEGYQAPLLNVIISGRVDPISALIELGADVNHRGSKGRVPLHWSVHCFLEGRSAAEATRLLLAAGADVHAVDEDGMTPLHCARHVACGCAARRGGGPGGAK